MHGLRGNIGRGLSVLRAAVAAIGLWLCAAQGIAETRLALVIGNGDYAHAGRLRNPVADAAEIAKSLRAAGFDVVAPPPNLDKLGFERALNDFAAKAASADVVVFYYAGHGLELDGVNYLVPVDASLSRDTDVKFQTVPLDLVLSAAAPARPGG